MLKFTVDSYELKEGLITFTDRLTGKVKRFPIAKCEIDEVEDD